MPTVAQVEALVDQVRDARPEALDDVVTGWREAGAGASMMLLRADAVDGDTARAFLNDRHEVYDAPGATARTRAATGEGGERFLRVAEAVQVVREELRDTRAKVLANWELLRSELQAVDEAMARLSAAAPTMTQPAVDAQAAGLRARADQALTTYGDRIAKLLNAYDDVLVSRTGTLADLGYAPAPSATAAAADGLPVPPTGRPPAEVNAWWTSLTPEQQAELIARDPGTIGNLDGVPVVDRDRANRAVLAAEIPRLEGEQRDLAAQLAQIDQQAGPRNPYAPSSTASTAQQVADLEARFAAVSARLDGLRGIDARLNAPADGRPPAYLVAFQPAVGNGRAAVAVGNPDTADNVVTHVPGTSNNLDNLTGSVERADATADSARKAAPNERTAVVAWLGYDAPQDLVEAAHSSYADDGEAALRSFQDGLRVTHGGPPSHNTIIGHSYGSTLVGHTARDGALDADALVFVASPGVDVDDVSQLHRPPGTVYATVSAADDINAANGHPIDISHGPSPTDPAFGARSFPADPTGEHGDYWRPGNPSLQSLGRIAVGEQP